MENSDPGLELPESDGPAAPGATGNPPGSVSNANDRHFRTDHLLTNLKQRTISSGAITLAAQGVKFALTLGSTMVLARLLTPRDFGLFAMVTSVTGFLRIFKDLGLSTATIQRETITQAQVSNLFWINVAVSTVLGLVVAGLAPVVAWFYREPLLVGVTLALSITFLLSGSTVQHMALLYRQMRFKAVALIEVGSMTVGVVGGIIAAWCKLGIWSLVISSLAMEASGLLFTWSVSRWRPQLPALHSGTRSMVRFGANLTVASSINVLSRNIDMLLLGRFYGAASVGIYSRAMALLMRPLDQLLNPVTTVIEPILARLQGEPERYRRTFLQIFDSLALVGFMAIGLLLALSRPVTLVLLGLQWEKASVIFAGFTGMALYAPLASALGFLLISQGRGRDLLVISVVSNFMVIAGIICGLPFGPAGVAIGWSVACMFGVMPYTYYKAGRQGPVHTQDLWLAFLKHLPVWGVVFGTTFMMLCMVGNMKPWMQLLICTPIGLLAGATVTFSMSHTRQTAFQILLAASGFIGQRKVKCQTASKS
jgi:PST family polysaccharide transporter